MPKRPKTPELNDGAKYLTVVNPYPPHPNLEIMQHRIEFAQWIAACTTPDYLLSFYHKPTSPGSVIIEIDESFPDFKRLLGAHKWSEFLVDPRDDGRFISKIFYCTFSSDRVVQKNGTHIGLRALQAHHSRGMRAGWKRIDVQDRWFRLKG
ncbi:hypothetical protein C2E23DRAFT_733751 [Lenzites betulinus]|nr:hypothetical protein C2E23DRAFT_733751 [Lenzites betulinus]